jgi:transcriptional regulator with XRE-family HTH domain
MDNDRSGRRVVSKNMAQPLPSYLRTHRRKWALTQRELAQLLGELTASAVSKYETLARTPSLEVMLGFEVVFDQRSHDLIPATSAAIRRTISRNATALLTELAEKTDARSARKRRLLDDLITRLTESHEELP